MSTAFRAILVCAALFAVAPPCVRAQATSGGRVWDFAAGVGDGKSSASASLTWARATGPGARVLLRYGVRSTWAMGDLELTAAGAHDVPAGVVDTLRVRNAGALMVNVVGGIGIRLAPRLEAAMNIDLTGFGVGGERTAEYRTSPTAAPSDERAAPSGANLFLYGSKDRGSLNSEFFAAWRARDRVVVRAGLSHLLTEYSATRMLTSNTRRFRQYSNLLFVAVWLER